MRGRFMLRFSLICIIFATSSSEEGAQASSSLFRAADRGAFLEMIDRLKIQQIVEARLEGSDMYLTDIAVSPDNRITVEIDSDTAVDIDECAAISRAIEAEFDRDAEDYELEVGSAGLTAPMKVRRQFVRNIGKDVEVLTKDGRKLHGVLVGVGEDESPLRFSVAVPVKVKPEGAKKAVVRQEPVDFTLDDVKYIVYDLKF